MAELVIRFVPATEVGAGVIFADLDPHLEWTCWWQWDMDAGWFGPIGKYINARTQQRRVRAKIFGFVHAKRYPEKSHWLQ
jgi:hypothetical protein